MHASHNVVVARILDCASSVWWLRQDFSTCASFIAHSSILVRCTYFNLVVMNSILEFWIDYSDDYLEYEFVIAMKKTITLIWQTNNSVHLFTFFLYWISFSGKNCNYFARKTFLWHKSHPPEILRPMLMLTARWNPNVGNRMIMLNQTKNFHQIKCLSNENHSSIRVNPSGYPRK